MGNENHTHDKPSPQFQNLLTAARTGNLADVKMFLSNDASLSRYGGRGGETALMIAAEQGHLDIVNALIEAGANPNQVDGSIRTPRSGTFRKTALHYAASAAHPTCVELLLKLGADPAHKNNKGQTAWDVAYQQKANWPKFVEEYEQILKILEQHTSR